MIQAFNKLCKTGYPLYSQLWNELDMKIDKELNFVLWSGLRGESWGELDSELSRGLDNWINNNI